MPEIKQWKIAEPWLKMECKLGEHPFYEHYSGRLRFLDIVEKKMHTVDPKQGQQSLETIQLKDAVGCTADIEGEESSTIIVGAKYGYAYMDRKTGALTYITRPSQLWTTPADGDPDEKAKRMRFNDGNIDPEGRFWAGMMNDPLVSSPDPSNPEGAVFVLSQDGSVRRAIPSATIPNGIGWSVHDGGKTMYYADSPTKKILAFDFDGRTGEISNKRTWWTVPEGEHEDTVPDGFCQDVDGCIWQALHGGGKVVRLKDVEGKAQIVGEVWLPTRCPTCPRIVGTELYVTSSEEENPDAFPESTKLAGSVFRVDVGVKGIEMNKWRRRGPETLGTSVA